MRNRYFKYSFIFILVSGLVYFFAQEMQVVLSTKDVGVVDLIEPYDCGVVLTGSPGRIREAFEILAQKKIKKLIISGVYKEAQLHEIFPHLPFYPEVHPDDIILEKISGSTYGNAVQSLAVVKTLRCQNVLLITSQLHMYRAYRIFRTIYPVSMTIKQYPVSHVAKDYTVIDLSIESFKSLFYTSFGRVL